MNRHLFHALVSAGLTVAAAIAGTHLVSAQTAPPRYEADLAWPKPLPNRWVLGGLGGLCVDAQGHVFILNRQDVLEGELSSGRLAPPIIEFDREGNVVNSWGDLEAARSTAPLVPRGQGQQHLDCERAFRHGAEVHP